MVSLSGGEWLAFAGSGAPPASGSCATEGATRTCAHVTSEHNGIVNCFSGIQVCREGGWGACVEDSARPSVSPTFAGEYEVETVTRDYTATCPAGMRPFWNQLIFEGVTPCSPGACDETNGSSIIFSVQTASDAHPDARVPLAPVVVAEAPSTHPSSCGTSSRSTPCPVDLYAALGPAAAENEGLELVITLIPSPDGLAGPSLSSWQVTYTCIEGG